MTLTSLEALMKVVESLIKSLAIVGAGVWSLYLYRVLRQRTRSQLELQKIQIEREKTDFEIRKIQAELERIALESKKQAVLQITIIASQLSLPNDSSKYISAIVEIENKGTRNTRLSFESTPPFLVTPIQVTKTGEIVYENSIAYPVRRSSNPKLTTPGVVIRAGGREQHIFFLRVDSPGAYLLAFVASLAPEEQEIAGEAGSKYPTSWTGKTLVLVKDDAECPTPYNKPSAAD
jgi:hypothetical protein